MTIDKERIWDVFKLYGVVKRSDFFFSFFFMRILEYV